MALRVSLLSLLAGTVLFGQTVPSFLANAIGPDPSQSQEQIAPGIIATLYGQGLGPETGCVAEAAEGRDYPTELCGTQVLFGNLPAPLLYAQKNQINMRIPELAPPDTFLPVRVVYQSGSSAPVPVWVARKVVLSPLAEPETVVEQISRDLQGAMSASSHADWERLHSVESCEESLEYGDASYAENQWCRRCISEDTHLSSEWAFYAFSLREPLACHLNRHWTRVRGVSTDSLEEVYRGLIDTLARLHGTSDDPGPPQAWGAGYWYKQRRWRPEWGEIYVYLTKPLFEPPHLGVLARAQPLLDAMNEDREAFRRPWGPERLGPEEVGEDLAEAMEAAVHCAPGEETFSKVIASGERILAEHPATPRYRDVVFLLAQAHETAWSRSLIAGEGDEEARQAAIRYYRTVMAVASGDPMAAYARRQLPRLELGINTNQRRFYCGME